jgi:hypothetical protein
MRRESSKYVHIRENSLEWNEPVVAFKEGGCCGIDPCVYEVQDKVRVVYFDDPIFDGLTDKTRTCNETCTCLFGGRGERLQMSLSCCFNLGYRSQFPCLCVPKCCPMSMFPCVLRHEIYLEDAQKALYEIKQVRKAVLESPTYKDPGPAQTAITSPAMNRT